MLFEILRCVLFVRTRYVLSERPLCVLNGDHMLLEWPRCRLFEWLCVLFGWPRCVVIGWPRCVFIGQPKCVVIGRPRCVLFDRPKSVVTGRPRCVLIGRPRCVVIGRPRCVFIERPKCVLIEWPRCVLFGWPRCVLFERPRRVQLWNENYLYPQWRPVRFWKGTSILSSNLWTHNNNFLFTFKHSTPAWLCTDWQIILLSHPNYGYDVNILKYEQLHRTTRNSIFGAYLFEQRKRCYEGVTVLIHINIAEAIKNRVETWELVTCVYVSPGYINHQNTMLMWR